MQQMRGSSLFRTSQEKLNKNRVLENKISETQALPNEMSPHVIGIQELVAEMSKAVEGLSITWEHIIEAIEEIQKQQNKDLTSKSWFIDHLVSKLNTFSDALGTKFKATVSLLAKHRNHVFGSKIDWFGQTNKTNSVSYLLEMCSIYKFIQSQEENIEANKIVLKALNTMKFNPNLNVLKKFVKCFTRISWTTQKSNSIYNDPQMYISMAIAEGRFGTDVDVLEQLVEFIDKMEWTISHAQTYLVSAISYQRFGTNGDVLKKLIIAIGNIELTGILPPHNLTDAIENQNFGRDPAVLKQLAESIGKIKWNNFNQHNIISAIERQKFGRDPAVLKQLAESIIQWSMSTSFSNLNIAETFLEQKFGTEINALEYLGKIQLFSEQDQTYLVEKIKEQEFANDSDTLKKLAAFIGKVKWTYKKAKECLAQAIYDQKFGNDPNVLKEIAISIGKIKWDDLDSQYSLEKLAQAIYDQKFGNDPDVLTEIAISIGKIKWDGLYFRHSLKKLAQAIVEQKFGNDPNVLEKLVISISEVRWPLLNMPDRSKLEELQKWLSEVIFNKKFGENFIYSTQFADSIGKISWIDSKIHTEIHRIIDLHLLQAIYSLQKHKKIGCIVRNEIEPFLHKRFHRPKPL